MRDKYSMNIITARLQNDKEEMTLLVNGYPAQIPHEIKVYFK